MRRAEHDMEGRELIVHPTVAAAAAEEADRICDDGGGERVIYLGSEDARCCSGGRVYDWIVEIGTEPYEDNPPGAPVRLYLEFHDKHAVDIWPFIEKAGDFIRAQKGAGLIHCAAGVSRSAAVLAGYLMQTRGMTYDEAVALIRAGRPRVRPNAGFQRQLRAGPPRVQCGPFEEQSARARADKWAESRCVPSPSASPASLPFAAGSFMAERALQKFGPWSHQHPPSGQPPPPPHEGGA